MIDTFIDLTLINASTLCCFFRYMCKSPLSALGVAEGESDSEIVDATAALSLASIKRLQVIAHASMSIFVPF